MGDVHILPVNDTRNGVPHSETRTCWCEPLIYWPCVCSSDKKCPLCGGSFMVHKDNGNDCVVEHEALDGRK